MTPDRWLRAEEIFHEAVDLPPPDRAAFLDGCCSGDPELRRAVEGLLAHQPTAAAEAVAGVVNSAAAMWADAASQSMIGRRIGLYRISGLIGQGGMGAVYRAVRDDDEFQKEVAIKLVKRGMDTDAIVQRFRNERQILANLEHPNIAGLHDGGTTEDGLPYFVMECINGRPVTDYCQAAHLPVRQRLQLFRTICETVQYAHQNLIVHRDLKPSNILVTGDGAPKLLDFGIAKVMGNDADAATLTLADGRMLTPDYGSPEQVRGEPVATTTDVYSLGTILYELLTGVRAHRIDTYTPYAVEQAICQTEPVVPSAATTDVARARELAGDLDNIVMRALQKEPARRYQSAAAFADDIRRYLDGLPVQARPNTSFYLAKKFATRHRGLLLATAAVFVALALGGLLALRQAQVAEARELQVRGLAKVFLFDVHDSIRDLPGATQARQTIVDTAVRYLDALGGSVAGDLELARELSAGYLRVGDIQGGSNQGSNVGAAGDALVSYRKAVGLLEMVLASAPNDDTALRDRFVLRGRVADLEARTRGASESLATYAAVVNEGRQLVERNRDDRAIRQLFAETLMEAGRRQREALDHEGSRASTTEALGILTELSGDVDDDDLLLALASTESAVGMAEGALGNLSTALAHYERAVAVNQRLVERQPQSVNRRRNLLLAYSHVGDVLGFPGSRNLGDVDGAARAYVAMAEIARELYEVDTHDARAAVDYAIALMRAGTVTPLERATDKQQLLERALSVGETVLARAPDDLGMRVNAAFMAMQLGQLFRDTSRWAEAAGSYRHAMRLAEPLLASGNVSATATFSTAQGQLAIIEARRSRSAAAITLVNAATSWAERLASRHTDPQILGQRYLLARAYGDRAAVHGLLGDAAAAREWRLKAQIAWRELEGSQGFTEQHAREARALDASQHPD